MKKLVIAALLAMSVFAFGALALAEEDGAALYKKTCSPCHGPAADKEAYGKPALKTVSEEDLHKMLVGYAEGTIDGKFKVLMEGVAKKLTEDQRNAIIKFIVEQK